MPDSTHGVWPELPSEAWSDTRASLQLWMQVVGKVRLALTPWLNHSWHVPLYLSARGLTTSAMACDSRILEIQFDFIEQLLIIDCSDGNSRRLPLQPQPVADFYRAVMSALAALGISVAINQLPCEIAGAIPFGQDRTHCAYDGEYAQRFWRVLLQADRVLKQFRTGFIGKCSPVHFFWGSFDLAVTRFSGRRAPDFQGKIPGVSLEIMREAYSHEVSSAGFWPGGPGNEPAVFYSYAYPAAPLYAAASVKPAAALYSAALGEFVLPYAAVCAAQDPDADLLAFFQSTYEAAAQTSGWDRQALECTQGMPRVPRPPDRRIPTSAAGAL